jgi:endonuclease YncB( thermonuclease family)
VETISATAEAFLHPDGTISTRTDVALNHETQKLFKELRIIEQRYPSIQPTSDAKLYDVTKVISGDIILLDDGTILRLAGIKCPHEDDAEHNSYFTDYYHIRLTKVQEYVSLSKTYLERLVKNEKVSFIEYSKVGDGSIMGYLWLVDFSLMNDPETKDIITGPSYTCINDTILTSGWGVADSKLQHSYSEKYTKLQKTAQEKQVGIWAKD